MGRKRSAEHRQMSASAAAMQEHPAYPDRQAPAAGPSRFSQTQQNTLAISRPRLPSLRHILLQEPAAPRSGNAHDKGSLVAPFHQRHPTQDGESSLSYGPDGGLPLGLQMLAPGHILPHATPQQKSWELALDLASNTLLLQRTRRYSFPSSFEHLAHLGQPFPVLRDTQIQHASLTYHASTEDTEVVAEHPAYSRGRVESAHLGPEPGMTDQSLSAARLSDDVEMEPVPPIEAVHSLPPLAPGMSSMRVSSNPPLSDPLHRHLLPSASSNHLFSQHQPGAPRAHRNSRADPRERSPPAPRDADAPAVPYSTALQYGRQSSGISRRETHSAPQVMLGSDRPALEFADPVTRPAHRHHTHESMGQQRGLALAEGYESEDIPYANAPSAHRRLSIANQHTLSPLSGTRQLPTFSPERMAGPSSMPVLPAASSRKRSLEEDEPVDDAGRHPAENGTALALRGPYSGLGSIASSHPSASHRHSQFATLRPLDAGLHAAPASDGTSWSYRALPRSSSTHREQSMAGNGGSSSGSLHAPLPHGSRPAQRAQLAYAGTERHTDASASRWEHPVSTASSDAHQVETRSESRSILHVQQDSGARPSANIEEEERDAALRLALLARAATAADKSSGLGSRPSRVPPQEGRADLSPVAQSSRHGSQASAVSQSHAGTSFPGTVPQLQLVNDPSSTPTTSLLGDGTQHENDEQQSASRTEGGAGHGRYVSPPALSSGSAVPLIQVTRCAADAYDSCAVGM